MKLTSLPNNVERPALAGDRWAGVPHRTMVEAIIIQLRNQGWTGKLYEYEGTRHGADIAALLTVSAVPIPQTDPALTPAIGVAYSNARRKALRFYVGALVGEGPFLLVTNTFKGSPFCLGFDLELETQQAIIRFGKLAKALPTHLTWLQNTTAKKATIDRILFNLGASKILPWSRVGMVTQAWEASLPTTAKAGTDVPLLPIMETISSGCRKGALQKSLDQHYTCWRNMPNWLDMKT